MNLIFDLDDTLYDMMQPFVRACHTIWEAPLPFDPWALFIRSRRISDQLYPLIAQGKMSVDEVGTARILQAAKELGEDIGEQAARRFQQHYRRFQYEAQLSDEMRALLDELSRSPLTIGILTNGPADHQRRKIEGLGLTRWFAEDHIFISGVIGMQKPDPRAFLHVQQALGSTRPSMVHRRFPFLRCQGRLGRRVAHAVLQPPRTPHHHASGHHHQR